MIPILMVATEYNLEQKRSKIEGQIILFNHMLETAGKKERYELTKTEDINNA